MALPIITVVETFHDREASLKGQTFERTYTRKFWVTSDINTDQQIIMLAIGLPRLGDIYVTTKGGLDTGAWCQEITARQRNEKNKEWIVEAHYSSTLTANNAFIQNPLLRPTIVSFTTKKFSRPMPRENAAGVTSQFDILNTAGDRYDPPAMARSANLVYTITRNMGTVDPIALRSYTCRINEFPYLGQPEGTLLVDDISASPESENGVNFYKVTAVLECASIGQPINDTWSLKLLECGYNELQSGTGKKIPILLSGGVKPSSPQLLDEDGFCLNADTTAGATPGLTGPPVYTDWDIYLPLDFTLLNLF